MNRSGITCKFESCQVLSLHLNDYNCTRFCQESTTLNYDDFFSSFSNCDITNFCPICIQNTIGNISKVLSVKNTDISIGNVSKVVFVYDYCIGNPTIA